jgi:hypothetical protein
VEPSLRIFLVPSVLILGLTGCHHADSIAASQLRWVEAADPVADARAAITQKDFRLKGVYGLTLRVPGVEPDRVEELRRRLGISPIEGTSDAMEGPEQKPLIDMAYKYAEAYNAQILRAAPGITPSPK